MSDYSEITFHANEDWIFKSAKYSLSSENVANNFKIFRQDGTLCDVDLVSGDTVVKAHRVVLAAACVYFETMFKSGLEEWNRKSVPLPSIAPDVLSLVVEFIYSGQTVISGSTVIHLVDAANMLQLQELSVGCAQYLRKQLHPSNVVGIIRLAETHNLVQLAEEALSYAMSHWGVVADGEEFVHLSLTTLVKLLTSDELVIDSEVQVLRAALRWLDHDPPSRREHCLEVLRQIRLRGVSAEEMQEALITVRDPAIAEILKTFKIVLSTVLREPRPRTGSCLYVVGGTQSELRYEAFRTALKFDGQAWTQIAPMSAPRVRPRTAALGGRVYAVGGMNGKGETLESGEMYDPRTDTWTSIAPMRTARRHFALAALRGKLYALGGFEESSIEVYDPATDEWAEVGEMPEQRWRMSAVTHAGAMYIVGGQTRNNDCTNDVLWYAPARGEWRRLRPLLLLPRDDGCLNNTAAAVHGQNLYLVGGWKGGKQLTGAVSCYNLETEQSHLVHEMSVPRAYCAAGVLGGALVMAGGYETNSVELYDLATGQWRAGPALPEHRAYAGAAVL